MNTINPQTAPIAIQRWLIDSKALVDAELDRLLALPNESASDPITRLAKAMRYAVLSGGKRLRPALVLATCEACGGTGAQALPAAAAIELLHAYTLVHDDLPAMDDDSTRRGQPTVHMQFDDATAILTGDALLTLAFGTLATLPNGVRDAITCLASHSGRDQLLGGQMLDLMPHTTEVKNTSRTLSFEQIERLHQKKTGALFAAACQLGAIAAGSTPKVANAMACYGLHLGVIFQHIDDIDDGDFVEHAAAANTRRGELTCLAETEAKKLGANGTFLADVARWIGNAV